jgi:Fic family protein
MPVLFELLANETEPAVRVVLGHFVFVYIHPYMDGNGRMGRFLMNVMLASGGYPWTIITLGRRNDYMAALEAASVGQDIRPFARFIGRLLEPARRGRTAAAKTSLRRRGSRASARDASRGSGRPSETD